jgi:hypothetical protein
MISAVTRIVLARDAKRVVTVIAELFWDTHSVVSCRTGRVRSNSVVFECTWAINPVTNPIPVYSHLTRHNIKAKTNIQCVYIYGKVVLVSNQLSITPWRRMGSEGTYNSAILGLGTRWRWVISFTPQPLYSRGKNPRYPYDRRLGGPQSRSGRCG